MSEMIVQLDYEMMAESVYALAALDAFEKGSERVIGRNEGDALRSRFQWALVDICVQLGPAVRSLLAQEGRVELVVGGDMIHHALAGAVLQRVLAELGIDTEKTAAEYMRVLKSVVNTLPYIEGHS